MNAVLTLSQMLQEMDRALDDEIKEKSNSKQTKYIAQDGKLLSEEGGHYIYRFTLAEPADLQDDTPLSVVNNTAHPIRCIVVTSTGSTLTIACDKPLPAELLQCIELCDDSTELLKRLRSALKEVNEGEAQLGSKCFKLVPYRSITDSADVQFGKHQPRLQQRLAVQKSLGGEVSFIVGPPGTGKTDTLAAIALKHLQTGCSVLIAAQTNIAVDNAIMRLCDFCLATNNKHLLANGQVVRYGAPQKAELMTGDDYRYVHLPRIAKEMGNQYHQRQDELKREYAVLKAQLATLQNTDDHEEKALQQESITLHNQLVRLQQEIEQLRRLETRHQESLTAKLNTAREALKLASDDEQRLQSQLAQTWAAFEKQKQELAQAEQSKNEVLARLIQAQAMGPVKRFIKGIKVEALETEVARVTQFIYQQQLSIPAQHAQIQPLHEKLASVQKITKIAAAQFYEMRTLSDTPSEYSLKLTQLAKQEAQSETRWHEVDKLLNQKQQAAKQQLAGLTQRINEVEAQLAVLEQQLRDIEKGIVEKARIVGTTLSKTYMNQVIAQRRFDVVILDEVSMASMPLIYVATAHADRSITLIGDPQQLAPIASANTPIVQKWLKRDLFIYRGISLEAAQRGDQHSVILNEQSRMHSSISIIARQYIYKDYLKDVARNFGEEVSYAPLANKPLVLCDTHDASPVSTRPTSGKSRCNYYHALCCMALVKQVFAEQPGLKRNASEPVIGIATPYAPQARLLQSLIKEAGLQMHVHAGTVHRFQGLEFPVLIFDTLESPPIKPGDFTAGSYGSDAMRLVNVAVTRPKHKLFIVANAAYIQRAMPSTSIMRLAVEEAQRSAILPSLNIIGVPFSQQMAKIRQQNPNITDLNKLIQKLDLEENILTLPSKSNTSDPLSEENIQTYPAFGMLETLEDEEFIQTEPSLKALHADEVTLPGMVLSRNLVEIEHLDEMVFYKVLKKDIQQAQKSILIASPFVSRSRVSSLLPVLQERTQHTVAIDILTRPAEGSEAWHIEALTLLRDADFRLHYLKDMHQKAVIIDEEKVYHGSLNILSHRNTSESMLRIKKAVVLSKDLHKSLFSVSQTQLPAISEQELKLLKDLRLSIRTLPPAQNQCVCGKKLVPRLRRDGTGAFYGCSGYPDCKLGSENITHAHLSQIIELNGKSCSTCGKERQLQIQSRPQQILLLCERGCRDAQKVIFVQ